MKKTVSITFMPLSFNGFRNYVQKACIEFEPTWCWSEAQWNNSYSCFKDFLKNIEEKYGKHFTFEQLVMMHCSEFYQEATLENNGYELFSLKNRMLSVIETYTSGCGWVQFKEILNIQARNSRRICKQLENEGKIERLSYRAGNSILWKPSANVFTFTVKNTHPKQSTIILGGLNDSEPLYDSNGIEIKF